jgi:hypothetical protein
MPMRGPCLAAVVLLTIITSPCWKAAAAQSAYLAGGGGPTPVLDEGEGTRNWFGMVGYPGPRGIGFRIAGTDAVSRFWLGADLTLQPAAPRLVRPYALLGIGLAIDFNDTDPVLTAGGGIRVQLQRLIFLFGEARLHSAAGADVGNPSGILPITFGLGIGT